MKLSYRHSVIALVMCCAALVIFSPNWKEALAAVGYDPKIPVPGTPSLAAVVPLNQGVQVTLHPKTVSAIPAKYTIEISDGIKQKTLTYSADPDGLLDVVIDGLTNGVSYVIKAFAIDKAEAASPPTETVTVIPQVAPLNAQQAGLHSPPLLFVHGVASTKETWGTTMRKFKDAKYQAYANSFEALAYNACQEMTELRGFVGQALANSGKSKLILIGHSQGGIVARGYLQFGPKPEEFAKKMTTVLDTQGAHQNQILACQIQFNSTTEYFSPGHSPIAGLITFGTPHNGADIESKGADAVTLLRPGSPFMNTINDFNSFPLPGNLPIVSIVGKRFKSSSDDCFIPASSQDLTSTGYSSASHKVQTETGVIHASYLKFSCPLSLFATPETAHYAAIQEALGSPVMRIALGSPADIVVRSPSGKIVSKTLREIWGVNYEAVEDEPGHIASIVAIPFPEVGDYQIEVIPHEDASPDAVFSLYVDLDGERTVLADKVHVADTPITPFIATVLPSNVSPIANPGANQTVRLGSLVTLDGSASSDPDNTPAPLSYSWVKSFSSVQNGAPPTTLNDPNAEKPSFTPNGAGTYGFSLTVSDGAATSPSATVVITVPKLGDVDLDGDVDNNDLNVVLAARNKPASGPNDLRDLDGNMQIDALDARKMSTLCTRPRCATQ